MQWGPYLQHVVSRLEMYLFLRDDKRSLGRVLTPQMSCQFCLNQLVSFTSLVLYKSCLITATNQMAPLSHVACSSCVFPLGSLGVFVVPALQQTEMCARLSVKMLIAGVTDEDLDYTTYPTISYMLAKGLT